MQVKFEIKVVFMLVFLTLFCFNISNAQGYLVTYPKGKIILKQGQIVKGTDLEITKEVAYLKIKELKQEFKMTDIYQIEAKKGKAEKWGMACCGGCLGVTMLTLAASGGETTDEYGDTENIDTGEYLLGAGLWAGIFYAGGYLVGAVLDDWETVYFGNTQ